MPTSLPC
jgi:hypothetical protein